MKQWATSINFHAKNIIENEAPNGSEISNAQSLHHLAAWAQSEGLPCVLFKLSDEYARLQGWKLSLYDLPFDLNLQALRLLGFSQCDGSWETEQYQVLLPKDDPNKPNSYLMIERRLMAPLEEPPVYELFCNTVTPAKVSEEDKVSACECFGYELSAISEDLLAECIFEMM